MRITRPQIVALLNENVRPAASSSTTVPPIGSAGILTDSDRELLLRWVRATTTPERVVMRSVVVLLAGGGWSNARIAMSLGVSRRTVALWKTRFAGRGANGLLVDEPGRGRKPGRDRQTVERIMAMTSQRPIEGQRWTVRSLARAVGASHATVQRVWREHDIRPFESKERSA